MRFLRSGGFGYSLIEGAEVDVFYTLRFEKSLNKSDRFRHASKAGSLVGEQLIAATKKLNEQAQRAANFTLSAFDSSSSKTTVPVVAWDSLPESSEVVLFGSVAPQPESLDSFFSRHLVISSTVGSAGFYTEMRESFKFTPESN